MPDIQLNMTSINNAENAQVANDRRVLKKKVFIGRNSILTDAFDNKHINGIYNLFIAGTVVLVVYSVLCEWRDNHIVSFGIVDLAQNFYKIEIAALGWLINMLLTILIFLVFRLWPNIYRRTTFKKSISAFFVTLYLVYIIGIQVISAFVCLQFNLSSATSMALLLETIRMGMKSYAYVRSNVGRITRQEEFNLSTFGHFMYFMWSPTLLYRKSYPRSGARSWLRVLKHLLELLVAVYSMSLLNSNFLRKSFIDYGKTEVTLLSLFIRWTELTVVMTLLWFFYAFYVLQHAWMNMFAELLQFDDRLFYKDWWNAKTFKEYYRCWNLLVHEWIYEYLYTDLYNHVTGKSFTLSALTTIIISAVVHEYIILISFRFFLPVLFVLYAVIGILFMYIELGNRVGNIFVWFNLIIGISLMSLLYHMEFYARINCPGDRSTNATISYYYTPMILACNNILIE